MLLNYLYNVAYDYGTSTHRVHINILEITILLLEIVHKHTTKRTPSIKYQPFSERCFSGNQHFKSLTSANWLDKYQQDNPSSFHNKLGTSQNTYLILVDILIKSNIIPHQSNSKYVFTIRIAETWSKLPALVVNSRFCRQGVGNLQS